jgi:hypothetical protein
MNSLAALLWGYGKNVPGPLCHHTISPATSQRAGCAASLRSDQTLGRCRSKRVADAEERTVDITGQGAHCAYRSEGNQRYYEGILDEVLTLFPRHQVLQVDIEFPQLKFHCSRLHSSGE